MCNTLSCVRIDLTTEWGDHDITPEEMRAVMEYPLLRARMKPKYGKIPFMFVGRYDDNEPPLEVGANYITEDWWAVFHAMLLRRSTARAMNIHVTHPGVFKDIALKQRR